MKILRNTFFLYISLFGGFILTFIQLKILYVHLESTVLGEFFTIVAFGRIAAGVILLGIPFVLVRYLPKFYANKEEDKMFSLLFLLIISYIILAILVYILLSFFGYKLSISIYKNELIGNYINFAFIVFSFITLFSIIFMAFNGLRKMHLGTALNLLHLSLLTLLLFIFRKNLSISLVLKSYLFSVIPSIIIGILLLFKEFKRLKLANFNSLIKEIFPYWKYAMGLGVMTPLFTYLDRLIIGYFLSMPMVALFTVASKIKGWVARIIDIPMEALNPEISHSWEKGNKKVLGDDLKLVIKLLFLLGFVVTTPVLICGKELINIISTPEYLDAWTPLWFLTISMILSCIYVPIASAMRSIGKISFFLITNVIWIVAYVGFTLLLIKRFEVVGVGAAYLLASVATLIFNLGYVAKHHTLLELNIKFFYKIIGFGLIFGLFTYFIFIHILGPNWFKVIMSALFVTAGYLLFLPYANLFSEYEKNRLQTLFTGKYVFLKKILN